MDHEPRQEFVSRLDKCKDHFLNILLCDANIRNASMTDEVKDRVDHGNDFQNDEEAEEEVTNKYIIHDPNVRWDKMEPKLGGLNGGYQIYFQKSDNRIIVAICGKRHEDNKCPSRLYATWMYNDRTFQVEAMNFEHLCSRVFKFGSIVTPCVVSTGQFRRAKQWAKELIEGKLNEHYARIWDYAQELLRSNPGSTCKVGVTNNPNDNNYFKRFYICFKSLSVCWKIGCRKVIGLDGCFLKGQVKGELLITIGRDANNQVFPIDWAVVDVEKKDNWTWFLELLKDDLDLGTGVDLVVISDQHKVILPHVEHRKCARHIYANFNKAFSGLELKKLFWACAMSCVEGDFLRNMEKIQTIIPSAYEYLMSKEPKTWCKAYMSVGFACEAVENGILECFNSIIIEARKKPLITILEEIRIYIMDRFSFMNDECMKWKGNICPKVIKKMNLFGRHFRLWLVVHSLGNVFEVRRACASYKVYLDGRVCSCRLWDLFGIPFVHGIASINNIHQTPDGYISDYFSVNKFKECYSTNISPVNGSNMWPLTRYNKPLPPIGRKMHGSPRTKRKRHASEKESKFSSTSRVKPPRTVPIPMPLKKIGRPRKYDVTGSNPHVSIPTQPSQQASQQGIQPPVTSTVTTQPSLRDPSFRVGDIASVGTQSSEVTVPYVRRKKLDVRRPNRKSKTKFQDEVNNQVRNEVAQAPALNDVPLVNETIKEEEAEVSVKVPEPAFNEVHLVNSQVPVVNDIPNNVAQVPAINDVPLVNEVIEEEDDIMVLEEEAVDVPIKVAQDLKQSLDEDGDAID
uniref:SWIM-type domain-containing protein n=1 Tax=Lactuca sativa TaxID=4236 RepID=A0A9R1XRA4_LACSA|nr:hypothetical protein LSAT_V11C300111730 [Lactuca sativa]